MNRPAVDTTADSFSLAGKIAIVTGSGRENGIGAATARALARNGASVAIHYVSESSAQGAYEIAQSIRDEYGVDVACVQGDISTPKGSRAIVAGALGKLGVNHIDILGMKSHVTVISPTIYIYISTIQQRVPPS